MDITTFFLMNVGRAGGGSPGPTPGPSNTPVLTIDGKYFRNHGERFTVIESSEFTLLKRFLENEDIYPLLQERKTLGFNTLRCWPLNLSVVQTVFPEGIHPDQYGDFYERMRTFVEYCGSFGFVVEITAFTSTPDLMPNVADQHRHWNRTQVALHGLTNVLLELVNEYDWGGGGNAPDDSLWNRRPVDIISSSGSATADAPPPQPVWDYVLHHTNGLNEWQRRVGHNTMEWADHYHMPGVANENMRYPDDDSSEIHAYDAAAGAALLCAGACFHSQSGKFSRFFDPVEKKAAEAWCRGAKSVPLEFQPGQYIRRDDLLKPHLLRVYERRLPDGRGHIVGIRA